YHDRPGLGERPCAISTWACERFTLYLNTSNHGTSICGASHEPTNVGPASSPGELPTPAGVWHDADNSRQRSAGLWRYWCGSDARATCATRHYLPTLSAS